MVFFLFPHSVLVEDDGIKVVRVWFDKKNTVVVLAITVKLLRARPCVPLPPRCHEAAVTRVTPCFLSL